MLWKIFVLVSGLLVMEDCSLFVVQVVNLWLVLFKPSQTLIYWTLGVGMGSLFILVLVDRLTNDEDRHYSKTVEK